MPQFNFRSKTNTLFAMALVAVIAGGLLSFRETTRLVQTENWISHTGEVLETSSSTLNHLAEATGARRGLLLLGTPQEAERFSKERDATLAGLTELKNLTADNSTQQERLQALDPMVRSRLEILKQSVDLHQRTGAKSDTDAQDAFSKQGLELTEQISEIMRGFHDTESLLLRQRLADAAATARRVYEVEIALAFFCFVLLIAALALINREISLRERSERAAKDAERLLRSVLDSSADAILVSDHQGRIILQNAAIARYNANVPADIAVRQWPEVFGVFQKDKNTLVPAQELPLVRAALYGESVDNMELYIRPPGVEAGRWHLASSRPLLDSEGRSHGGLVVLRDINERKTLEEDRDRLVVSGRLLKAQDEERARIARELHDGVTQSLAMLMIRLHTLKESEMAADALRNQLEETEHMCGEVGEEVRALSHRMHSSKLEYLGFAKAAQSLCNELTIQKGVQIELNIENVPARLPSEVSLGLFRVLQEALQNAIKHGGVSDMHIEVDLSYTAANLRLRVRDSGAGFNLSEVSKATGLGVISMRERLHVLGGSLSIQSAPGQGTTVDARVPFSVPQTFAAIAS